MVMKKKDTKPKSKPKTKNPNTKLKQKQKQNQSVVINIKNVSGKTASKKSSSASKPSYLQTITTYPIFREAPYEPLYNNTQPIKETTAPFIDKSTIRTETPIKEDFIPVKTVKPDFYTPRRSLYDYITTPQNSKAPSPSNMSVQHDDSTQLYDSIPTKRNLDSDFSNFVIEPKKARVNETRLPLRGRPRKILTAQEKEERRIERNKKRANKYAQDKQLRESS